MATACRTLQKLPTRMATACLTTRLGSSHNILLAQLTPAAVQDADDDNDGVPDHSDHDDDGDGISDADEKK